jgi:glycosyltransferase involved in cell wall biosynthesis
VVWDSVDCISNLFRQAADQSATRFGRWLTRFELGRTTRHEGWLISQFNRVLVTTPLERTALLSLLPAGQKLPAVNVLPNGVDLTYFKPCESTARERATIVVSGKMSYHANAAMVVHFVRDILPAIWARRPDVRLCVVGQNPPPAIRALTQDHRIRVIGTTPDIRPYLQSATLAVAPLTYGVGIQNKVLEAMACATPMVASPHAVAALAVKPGEEVLVAREPAEYSKTVLDLLDDCTRQRQLGEAGRRFVEGHHRWDRIAAQLVDVYDELVCANH